MKERYLVALIALASCSQQSSIGCPAIDKLAQRDAVADARAALEKGDHHLLMLGGFAGEVPGVSTAGAYPTQMVEGTSDTTTEGCSQQRNLAEAYAAKYNQTIVKGR